MNPWNSPLDHRASLFLLISIRLFVDATRATATINQSLQSSKSRKMRNPAQNITGPTWNIVYHRRPYLCFFSLLLWCNENKFFRKIQLVDRRRKNVVNADCRSQIGKWLLLVTGIYQTIVTACAAPPLLACSVFRLDFTGLLYEVICGRPVLADNLSHLAFVSSNNARTSRSRHSLAVPDASRPIDWTNLFTLSCENCSFLERCHVFRKTFRPEEKIQRLYYIV